MSAKQTARGGRRAPCKDAEPNKQPEEDAEPLCKDAEPNKQPEEDAEPPARTQSHLEGRRAT